MRIIEIFARQEWANCGKYPIENKKANKSKIEEVYTKKQWINGVDK